MGTKDTPNKTLSCWCCSGVFFDTGRTDASKPRHGHHVIPRAYGGSKGPVVDICSEDHTTLHQLALDVISSKDIQAIGKFVKGAPLDTQHKIRVGELAQHVVNAEAATRNDPNKRVIISTVLTGAEGRMLDQVGKVLGSKSRSRTVLLLIQRQYNQSYPLQKE